MKLPPWLQLILGGLITTAAFAPIGFAPGVVLGPLLLLLNLRGVGRGRALARGWLFGFAHFLSAVWWVLLPMTVYSQGPLWSGVLLWWILAAYLGLFPAVAAGLYAACRPSARLGPLLLWPACWLAGEFLRNFFFDGFPWFSLGYLATAWSALLDLAAVLGVHGVSLWFALLAGVAALALQQRVWRLPLALTLALCSVWLLPAPSSWTDADGPPVETALVQGNIPQDQKWQRENFAPTLRLYEGLIEQSWPADLVILPEAALPAAKRRVEAYMNHLDQRAREAGGALLLGVITLHEERAYNTVYALGAAAPQRYVKQHLVPFGEYVPAPDWARPLVAALDLPFPDISPDLPGVRMFHAAGVDLSFSICFEDVFPEEVRATSRDSGLLVNVTNDAWFAGTGAPRQHLQIAQLRAAESGRPMLRVANTGISALIDADGGLARTLAYGERGLLRVSAQPRRGLTPYQRWGQWPLYLWMVLAALVTATMWRFLGARQN